MMIHALCQAPPPPLARSLGEFEGKFAYPLGPGRSFRISHGEDYPRFFRAMGETPEAARCFVAEQAGVVRGVIGAAIRSVQLPDGSRRRSAYIGDVKVDPGARGSLLFLRLAQAGLAWGRPLAEAAYGVVMDGTAAAPSSYTGRIGVPAFGAIAHVSILRLATAGNIETRAMHNPADGMAIYEELSSNQISAGGGNPAERSEMSPLWLTHPTGDACGRLEDTRRAKRLIGDDGIEMHSAHLTCFAWRSAPAAAEVIHAARRCAAALGIRSLFVCIPARQQLQLLAAIGPIDIVIAPATVYGAQLPAGIDWSINSSEI